MIKLSTLQKFLLSSSAAQNSWAKSLLTLGLSLDSIASLEVVGVAPDFGEWYVCFYVKSTDEDSTLATIRHCLRSAKADSSTLTVVQKAREFGRKNGHRRVILRIDPAKAEIIAANLYRAGRFSVTLNEKGGTVIKEWSVHNLQLA